MGDIPPTAWLERLEERTNGVLEVPDPDHVHELRVACARLIVWLDLGGWRTLRDDLRWLRRSAATVRDLDVVLHRFRGQAWAHDLAAQRGVAASDLLRVLSSPRVQGIHLALSLMPPVPEDTALEHLAHERRRTLRAGKRLDEKENDLAQVHRLRRAVRRLRYVLEWISEAPEDLASLQTELGTLNDLAVADRVLSGRAAEDGIVADRAQVEQELRDQCEKIEDAWSDARKVVERL
jgi:CHAD domain-containing protein